MLFLTEKFFRKKLFSSDKVIFIRLNLLTFVSAIFWQSVGSHWHLNRGMLMTIGCIMVLEKRVSLWSFIGLFVIKVGSTSICVSAAPLVKCGSVSSQALYAELILCYWNEVAENKNKFWQGYRIPDTLFPKTLCI